MADNVWVIGGPDKVRAAQSKMADIATERR